MNDVKENENGSIKPILKTDSYLVPSLDNKLKFLLKTITQNGSHG